MRASHLIMTLPRLVLRRALSGGSGTSTPSTSASSTVATSPICFKGQISMKYDHGLPVLSLELPSRKEECQFLLRPLSDSVAIFCESLSKEDKGIDYVAIHTKDGIRVAGSTSIEHLLQLGRFTLRINDDYFDVIVPQAHGDDDGVITDSEHVSCLNDLKAKVAALHTLLNVDEFKLKREQLLILRLEAVTEELRPLEKVKLTLDAECKRISDLGAWAIFVFMGLQTGVLFRLTYYDYSWDVIEPVSFFLTYSTMITSLGYYLYTRESFDYPTATKREFSKQFYKLAARVNFDVDRYTFLVKQKQLLLHDLERIRDPLFQHLPVTRLAALELELARKVVAKTAPTTNPANNEEKMPRRNPKSA